MTTFQLELDQGDTKFSIEHLLNAAEKVGKTKAKFQIVSKDQPKH